MPIGWRDGRWNTLVFISACALAIVACGGRRGDDAAEGSGSPSGDEADRPLPGAPDPTDPELPWEIRSEQGETYVPNVFYAEATDNEQIMPLKGDDGRYGIDRMIYPTLGNPNIYVRTDPADSLTVVLRMEESAIAHLTPTEVEVPGTSDRKLELHETPGNALAFELVRRGGREAYTETDRVTYFEQDANLHRIQPSEIWVKPVDPRMPEAFKKRRTLRVIFRQEALEHLPAGLYDLRFEAVAAGRFVQGESGNSNVYEAQYNAVRIYDLGNTPDEYNVLNVTDTQVSMGDLYDSKTKAHLHEFVSYVNASTDPEVTNSKFITFNGDLHNGGSPGGIRQRFVANTYRDEAREIVQTLKQLRYPIFLTIGNHDGYVSMGHVAGGIKAIDAAVFDNMGRVIRDAGSTEWPGFSMAKMDAYLQRTKETPGGLHRDIFVGSFVRRPAWTFAEGWISVPREERNMVLYDGLQQWQRSYGPTYFSHRFGKNHYISVNTFELRQHRRSGWGMYTVNYGGGMSDVQLEWLSRELGRTDSDGMDAVLLAHHDPRGGHKGKDFPYYFDQLEYTGMGVSAKNYLEQKFLTPFICGSAPSWMLTDAKNSDCLHDGLQEWMRADEEFDCDEADRLSDGRCDTSRFDPALPIAQRRAPRFSGYELISLLALHPSARTLLLGHTHYHSLEMLVEGDELIPSVVALDEAQRKRLASAEVTNPLRGLSEQTPSDPTNAEYDPEKTNEQAIEERNGRLIMHLELAGHRIHRTVEGARRELAIVRLTSNADLTHQLADGNAMMGFSVMVVRHRDDARAYSNPQIDKLRYYQNIGSNAFRVAGEVLLDRTQSLKRTAQNNPVEAMFQL